MIMYIVLTVADIVWIILVFDVWTETTKNDAWNNLYKLHIFTLALSIINVILKLVVIFFINSFRST